MEHASDGAFGSGSALLGELGQDRGDRSEGVVHGLAT